MGNNEIIKYNGGLVRHVEHVVSITNKLLSKDFYRAVIVENMVKDAMGEGFETLNDIKEAITNGLGIDSPIFRKMIDDAYAKIKGAK